jgi:predicted esterase
MLPYRSIVGPHADAEVVVAGTPLAEARGALILIHGRGATAEGMLDLARHFRAERFALVAPQANGNAWYPFSFLMPIAQNQPHLDSALALLTALTDEVARAGIPRDRQVLLGFSQGACLAQEFAARSGTRWGGVVGLSGGLIGPSGTPRDYPAGFAGTPVILGCSDVDAHIPEERVHESARVFEQLGGQVTERIYPGMAHTINEEEVGLVRDLLGTFRAEP